MNNNWLIDCFNFKSIFSLVNNFYLLLLLIELSFSQAFLSSWFFRLHKWSPNISNRHHKYCNIGYHLIVWYFPFHELRFETTLRVLKPVLCFHMTSFNYDAKRVMDVDPSCRPIRAILCVIVSSVLTSYRVYVTCGWVCCHCVVVFFVCVCVSVYVCLWGKSGLLLFVEIRYPVFSLLQKRAWGSLKL